MTPRLITRAVGVAACTAGLVFAGAGTASAGEITGNGQFKAVQGKSLCAYSGQNDGYHDPSHQEFPGDNNRVQSYGQIVKQFGGTPGGAGRACNPNYPPPPPPG